ncbi:YoaK family protein [Mycoplana ramosa]|uniref:YoaK family protein n=1 Tax=Mycoplana ramosa TaxID=40837 RepID=A0ABW3YSG1_MYCRA
MTVARRRRLIRRQRSSVGLALVAAISFLAGMTDAIGLMAVGEFVSFMSGNTTRAAVAIGQGDTARALLLFAGLTAFVLGNGVGVIIASRFRSQGVLLCVTLLLAGSAAVPDFREARFLLLIFAMGTINAAVEQIEGLPIGLTYVTGGLSRFGRGLGRWILGGRSSQWFVQLVPWCGMLAGAVAGATLQQYAASSALWAPFTVAALVTAASILIPRRWSVRFLLR